MRFYRPQLVTCAAFKSRPKLLLTYFIADFLSGLKAQLVGKSGTNTKFLAFEPLQIMDLLHFPQYFVFSSENIYGGAVFL